MNMAMKLAFVVALVATAFIIGVLVGNDVTTPDWAIKERFDMEDRKADCHELLGEIWIKAANDKFYCVKEIR